MKKLAHQKAKEYRDNQRDEMKNMTVSRDNWAGNLKKEYGVGNSKVKSGNRSNKLHPLNQSTQIEAIEDIIPHNSNMNHKKSSMHANHLNMNQNEPTNYNANQIPTENNTTDEPSSQPNQSNDTRKLKFNNRLSLDTNKDSNNEEQITIADRCFDFQKTIIMLNKRPYISCFDSLTWFIDRMKLDVDC